MYGEKFKPLRVLVLVWDESMESGYRNVLAKSRVFTTLLEAEVEIELMKRRFRGKSVSFQVIYRADGHEAWFDNRNDK